MGVLLKMKINAQEFKSMPKKSITLIGMSGAGKTHISCQLEKWGWQNYSCDFEIASKYLKEELGSPANISADDISSLSDYLGKIGNPKKGGFLLDKFKKRQKAYYDAECAALDNISEEVSNSNKNFVNDSTGSLVEIEDDALIQKIGEQTLFVYLKTGDKEEQDVLKRAKDYPKPLFFPPEFLAEKKDKFLSEFDLNTIEDMEPDEFARWVFPLLFEARKPKYQKLADLYGVTIPSSKFMDLKSSDEFIEIIAEYLD